VSRTNTAPNFMSFHQGYLHTVTPRHQFTHTTYTHQNKLITVSTHCKLRSRRR